MMDRLRFTRLRRGLLAVFQDALKYWWKEMHAAGFSVIVMPGNGKETKRGIYVKQESEPLSKIGPIPARELRDLAAILLAAADALDLET